MKNFVTEDDLKGLIPELSRYLWGGETNYSKQKAAAEDKVVNDFIRKGYRDVFVRTDLVLRKSGTEATGNEESSVSSEDKRSRLRFVIDIKSITDSKTFKLLGSDDKIDWTTIKTVSLNATGETSYKFTEAFRYYKVQMTWGSGAVDYKAYLTETIYDLFIEYKWLELILLDNISEDNDQYEMKMKYFQDEYRDLWSTSSFFYSDTGQENVDQVASTSLRFSRG